jgi:hypothetical protein
MTFGNVRTYAALGWGALILLIAVPKLQTWRIPTRRDRIGAETSARQTLVQALLGLLLLAGGWQAWLQFNYNINEKERGIRAAQRLEVTDRFGRAVEQLADDRREIRIGAIYALERIVEDAHSLPGGLSVDSRKLQRSVVELLCAYIQQRSPWRGPDVLHEDGEIYPDGSLSDEPKPELAADIQTALTVIGRRRPDGDAPGPRTWRLDRLVQLSNTDLRGADLPNAFLKSADLSGAHLERAYLSGADLQDADLRSAYLVAMHGWFTDFSGALIEGAHLEGSFLKGAKLPRARLWDQHVKGLILSYADLSHGSLGPLDFSRSDLQQEQIEDMDYVHPEVRLPTGVRLPLIPATPEHELMQIAHEASQGKR